MNPAKMWIENAWPETRRRDPVGQQGIIGRVIDGVGEPQQRVHHAEGEETRDQRRGGQGNRTDQQAADQHRPCRGAIDQEAGRRLQQRRNDVERRDDEAELGIADIELGPHMREQRRQHEHIDVADEMGRANEADRPKIGRARRQGGDGGLRHYSNPGWPGA